MAREITTAWLLGTQYRGDPRMQLSLFFLMYSLKYSCVSLNTGKEQTAQVIFFNLNFIYTVLWGMKVPVCFSNQKAEVFYNMG